MDAAVRKAIARIDIIHEGKTLSRGTGSLVSDRFVLTALHVVANRQTSPPTPYPGTISLTFPAHTTEALIHEGGSDAQSDWVLLECADPPRVRPLPLGELNESGSAFETFGFPEIQPIDGIVQRGTVDNHDAELLGTKVLQLFSHQAAAADGAPVNGSSGSPVLVENALVGVLRAALLNAQGVTRAGTLYACPLGVVLDRCGDLLPAPDPCRGLPGLRRRPLPAHPFTYLNRFTAAEAEIFFGRNRDIRHLYKLLTGEDTPPVVLLYGQAGVGKSSFLEAAVLPRLEWTHTVRYARSERGERLLQTLLRTIEADAGATTTGLDARWRRLEESSGRPLVVILDQIEEIFVQDESRGEELAELVSALVALFATGKTHPQSRVVLSFRKEWFPEIQKAAEEAGLSYGKVFLDRLDRESVVEVVSGLTSTRRLRDHYGLSVDERLPALIADDLQEDRDSPIAPTLRIVLSKMWEQATSLNRSAPVFSVESYQHLRRQGILLGDFLDQQISGLAKERATDVTSGLVIDVLAFHTSPLLTAQQRAAAELQERYRHRQAALPGLVQAMKRQWLLVDPAGDTETDARATRLSHDTLAPLVRQRFDDSDLPGQRARRILESRTDWRSGRNGVPLDAADLGVVESGLDGMRALDDSEQRLLEASRQRRAKEQGWRRARIAVGVVLVVMIAAAGAISSLNYLRAEEERRKAVSAARLVQAREALESDPALAAQILAELDGYPEPADGSRTAYLTLNRPIPVAILRGHEGPIRTVSVSPDNRSIVTTSDDETARVWRLDNKADPIVLDHRDPGGSAPGNPNWVLGGFYNPQSGNIATYARDIGARLWSSDGKLLHTLAHDDTVDGAAFDKNGTRLLTTTARGSEVRVWDAGTGKLLHSLPHPDRVISAAFGSSPTAEGVLTFAAGRVRIWTLGANGAAVEQVVQTPENAVISAVGFSSDGKWIAFGERRGPVWIQPASATGAALVMSDQTVFGAPVREIQFSPDGQLLAVRYDGIVQLWESSGRSLSQLSQVDGGLRRVAFSADGRFIAAASDHRVWLWPRTEVTPISFGVGRPTELKGHSARVESIAFTSDGNFVVTASSDRTARVWRTAAAEPQMIHRVPSVWQAALAPGGAYAAVISNEGPRSRLGLWRLSDADAAELSSMPAPNEPVTIRVSRTGSHVLTVSRNGQLRAWRSNAQTRQLELVLDRPHIAAAAFDSDGTTIKVVDAGGDRIRPWQIGTEWIEPPALQTGRDTQVGLSLDGSRLIRTSPDTGVTVSGTNAGTWIELGVSAPNARIVFDARGSRVLTDTGAGTSVWNLNEGQPAAKPLGFLLPKTGDTVAFAAFNPDGSRVLALDVKRTARVFSSDGTGSPIELAGEFDALTFDNDGSHVIGVAADGRVLRLQVGWQTMLHTLANATTACLTSGQRTQFFGEPADVAQAASLACQERKRKP